MVKIGLIGTGFMGGMHSACYEALRNRGAVVTAIADLDAQKAQSMAEKHHAQIFPNGLDLIENADVDIVDICLPTYLHARHAVAAMKKGKSVFIEKPVCLTMAETDELLRVQQQTGTRVMVGQCIRLWREYDYLHKLIDEKTYGNVLSGAFHRLSPKPTWAWDNWLNKAECSGSMATDMHIHDADVIRYLFGEPEGVQVAVQRDVEGVIQHIVTQYQYDGTMIFAEGSWDYPSGYPFSMGYRVKFEDATVVFDSANSPTLKIYPEAGGVLTPSVQPEAAAKNSAGGNISDLGAYYTELAYFINCVQKNSPVEKATLPDAIRSLELIHRELDQVGGAKA